MPAWTFAGTLWNTTAGTKTVTATPAVGDLIVIVAGTSGLAGGTTACSDDNSVGAYTQVDADRTYGANTGVLTVWVRTVLVPAAVSTVFTATQASSSGGGLHVYRLSGMTLTGAAAVRSFGGQSAGGAGTTPAPVLSDTPLPFNPILIAVASDQNAASMNPRTNYVEGADAGYNVPTNGMGSAVLDTGETSATLTFGGTTAAAFGSTAIEFESQKRSYPGFFFASTAIS